VRGTTARRRIRSLREAGAREVHVRVSCPPTAFPCYYGIDFPTREELIAGTHDVESIRKFIGADSLGYLSEKGLLAPFAKPGDFCTACFTGRYPVDPSGAGGKNALESRGLELNLHV
jgi:amidophosphoribosyltransferase